MQRRKIKRRAACVLFAAALSLCGALGYLSGRSVKIRAELTYYLLSTESDEAVEVFAKDEYYSGGAGYIVEEKSVLSYYLSEADADVVRDRLINEGKRASVQAVSLGSFRLRGRERAGAEAVRSAIVCIDGTLRALYRIANGIDTLAYSQEGGKALLADVSTVLQAVAGIEERGTCSENIAKMAKECASSLSGREIVYARDVRAAGVALCLAFVALGR